MQEVYGKRPISFEVNQGQTHAEVRFLSRGPEYNLFLTLTEAVLALKRPTTLSATNRSLTSHVSAAAGVVESPPAVIRMRLVGSAPSTDVTGLDPLAGKANYFIGDDPEAWRTDIPTYARVRYKDVYTGVDLVYYGKQHELEYDFVLAPGTDPSVIRVRFPDTKEIRLDTNGDLVMRVGEATMRQRKPFVYQEVGTVRREITSAYLLGESGEIGFRVGEHDPRAPLVIDPVLIYSTYLGGAGLDRVGSSSVAVDASGSAYVTGETLSTDFPTTPGAFQRDNNGGRPTGCVNCDGFVTKFDASGSIVYSTYLGGRGGANTPGSIAVDAFGNAYVAGSTDAPDFPTTPGAFQRDCTLWPGPGALEGQCAPSGFVTKLDPNGSALVYSTKLYGSDASDGGTSANGIAIDDSLNAFIVGRTGLGFPVTPGAFQSIKPGEFDGFVAKLNATGSALLYATYLGGRLNDLPAAIAIDRSGNAYVAGDTRSEDFPTTPNAFQTTCPIVEQIGGCSIAFVAKVDNAGTSLVYSTFLGGSGFSISALQGVSSDANAIAADELGYAYVAGSAKTTDFPTTLGALKPTTTSRDAFVTKVNLDGTGIVYSTFLGGDAGGSGGFEEGNGIAVDSDGNAYVVGSTESTDFPVVNGIQATYGGGIRDVFVAKLNPSGSALIHSTYLGGAGQEQGTGIDFDAAGTTYVTGSTESNDFPTANPAQPALAGQRDAFVAKLAEPTCSEEVTDQVDVLRSRLYRFFFTRFHFQWVVVRNRSTDSIQGPLAYVLEDLQNAVFLSSRMKTVCFSRSGDPFFIIRTGRDDELGPDEWVFALLVFFKTQPGEITYTPRVLSGIPTQ